MSIQIDSCAPGDRIAVTTISSLYELLVVRGGTGEVLVRGGSHFPEFSPAVFAGSRATDGSVHPGTIVIGLRMQFVSSGRVVVTSAVVSLSQCRSSAEPTECAAAE